MIPNKINYYFCNTTMTIGVNFNLTDGIDKYMIYHNSFPKYMAAR